MQNNSKVVPIRPLEINKVWVDEMADEPPAIATAIGKLLRRVIILAMRLAAIIGVITVVLLLAGCAGGRDVDQGNGIHVISYTEEGTVLGVAPGWYGAVSGRLMDDASAACPAGYTPLSTKVIRGTDTSVIWVVRCQ